MLPPFRIAQIEPSLFRSGYPTPRNYTFLRGLHLRTIVSLTDEAAEEQLSAFCASEGIRHVELAVPRGGLLTHEHAAIFLELAVDPANGPLLVHCLDGSQITGRAVMCLRKLQLLHQSFAVAEFQRFLTEDGELAPEDVLFVEAFRNPVTIPAQPVAWLWRGGLAGDRHPSIPLLRTAPPAAATTHAGKRSAAEAANSTTPPQLVASGSTMATESQRLTYFEALALELPATTRV